MATHHCIVAGHPHPTGSGCVLDDPNATPPAPPAPVAPGFPPALSAEVLAVEGVHVGRIPCWCGSSVRWTSRAGCLGTPRSGTAWTSWRACSLAS